MESIERVWTQQKNSMYIFWDLGNEIWDFDSDGECRHYRMEKRSFISKNPVFIKETLTPLPFTPVPLEAIQKQCFDWKVVKHKENTLPSVHSPSKELKQNEITKEKKQNKDSLLSSDSVTIISNITNDSCNEVWTSLSQWIPSYALYQPSLHKQATIEINDTPSKQYFKPKQNLFTSDKPLFI